MFVACEGDLNACIEIFKSSALQQAAEADAKIAGEGERRSPSFVVLFFCCVVVVSLLLVACVALSFLFNCG